MKLNFLERLFITSPVRPLIQRHLEARQLLKMGGTISGKRALEIGCGPGSGIDLIYNRFGASTVDAFDMDPQMVSRARRRQQQRSRCQNLWAGNVRYIPVENEQYDAVFNFGVLHHVVDWRAALAEIYRVLKPGGRLYCEEILKRFITHLIVMRLLEHPQEDRFDRVEFIRALRHNGFRVLRSHQMAEIYLWVIATKPERDRRANALAQP